ncbi:MAG: cation:proton antiporter, partial [Paludibacter sp.]|nr:cation:proton antiporter [Paludibacter sp.]
VGPNGLHLISMSSAIELLGSIGLLYIMFIAGLEIDFADFKRNKNKSIVFGMLTFLIPQLTGMIVFRLLGFSWAASILVASMFASHTLVGYPIITRLGITKNIAVLTTVGGTIITDTLALLILAVVARSVTGSLDTLFWISLAFFISMYFAIVTYFLPKIGKWFFKHNDDGTLQFYFVLIVAFGCSFLAKLIGIEPIIGAFLAGLVLNRMIPASSILMNRVQFVGNSLFIPFFLLYIGMIVDVEMLFRNPSSWFVMIAMLATNTLTKLVSSKITQKIFKFTPAEGWVIFGLSTTEAAATLAATLVGYRLKIIGDDVLNGVILMILITCIIGPLVVEYFGKQIAQQKDTNLKLHHKGFKHILVPVYNPSSVSSLLSLALILKEFGLNRISALYVITNKKNTDDEIKKSDLAFEEVRKVLHHSDFKLNTIKRLDLNVANGIRRATIEEHADVIVLGWNEKASAQEKLFGTILDQILEHSNHPVLVCRTNLINIPKARILLYLNSDVVLEPGFPVIFNTILSIAKGIDAHICVVAEQKFIDSSENLFLKIDRRHQLTHVVLTDVRSYYDQLIDIIRDDDLFIAIGTRKRNFSWLQPNEKLPQKLANKYKNLNFIFAYPGIQYDNSIILSEKEIG